VLATLVLHGTLMVLNQLLFGRPEFCKETAGLPISLHPPAVHGRNRVARLMQINKIKAVRGYKAPRRIAGRPSIIAPNRLNREFTVDAPDQAWVTDITYIRTWQGWLYLAVVVDLFARKAVGWSIKSTLSRELVIDALLMAV